MYIHIYKTIIYPTIVKFLRINKINLIHNLRNNNLIGNSFFFSSFLPTLPFPYSFFLPALFSSFSQWENQNKPFHCFDLCRLSSRQYDMTLWMCLCSLAGSELQNFPVNFQYLQSQVTQNCRLIFFRRTVFLIL